MSLDPFASGAEEDLLQVTGTSGATYYVLNEQEQEYFRERADRYMTDNHVTNITDLQDFDRMLVMELLTWRWGNWLSQERDYWGNQVDLEGLKKALNEYYRELRLMKKALGLDKAARDREKGESFVDYLENLRMRAREFGVMREEQLTKCITLFQELKAQVIFHNKCTPEERREQNVEMEDIFNWIQEVAIPEFDAIDEYFRVHNQKYWVRSI